MPQIDLEEIGLKLGVNCGGKGGKPGPCPTDGTELARPKTRSPSSKRLKQAIAKADDLSKIADKTNTEESHHAAIRARQDVIGGLRVIFHSSKTQGKDADNVAAQIAKHQKIVDHHFTASNRLMLKRINSSQ